MGEENQTILKKDPSDPKRRRALFHVVEKMRAMQWNKEFYYTLAI